MNINRCLRKVATTSCVILASCGGGGEIAPGPAIADNVLMSSGLAANAVVVTVNHAGYLRAYGDGTDQPLTIGLGTVPLTGNANSATSNGWVPSSNSFVKGNATLSRNSDGKTYSLQVQGTNTTASDSTLTLNTMLVAPTVASLAGTYGIASSQQIVITGTSFSGTYGLYCTWSGNLALQTNTVDVTNIQFATATSALNPNSIACPYTDQIYTGTAFLMGPSDAYPKGVFVIQWDDGGANTPTEVREFYFARQ